MDQHVGIEDARKTLGELVAQAQDGTEIVLTRHGKPAARIVAIKERPVPTMLETLTTYRLMATVPPVVDTLGLDTCNPASLDLAKSQVGYEAQPFAALIADIDAFFGDELGQAFTGPEAAEAEATARRIIAVHHAAARIRLSLSSDVGSQLDWTNATSDTLQNLAGIALQRAADVRFAAVVDKVFAKASV
jgi:prevent-host-death family protein